MVSNTPKVAKKSRVNRTAISCDRCKARKTKVSCVGLCLEKHSLIGGSSATNPVSGLTAARCSRSIADDQVEMPMALVITAATSMRSARLILPNDARSHSTLCQRKSTASCATCAVDAIQMRTSHCRTYGDWHLSERVHHDKSTLRLI
jgi:hypothetical protein